LWLCAGDQDESDWVLSFRFHHWESSLRSPPSFFFFNLVAIGIFQQWQFLHMVTQTATGVLSMQALLYAIGAGAG
jgi:hypothetical protein